MASEAPFPPVLAWNGPGTCDALEFGGGWPSVLDGRCRCMVCARCGHHTGNASQGHYWSACQVTGTIREPHFCCPDNSLGCELGAVPDGQ